jgi:hypothetical protein
LGSKTPEQESGSEQVEPSSTWGYTVAVMATLIALPGGIVRRVRFSSRDFKAEDEEIDPNKHKLGSDTFFRKEILFARTV